MSEPPGYRRFAHRRSVSAGEGRASDEPDEADFGRVALTCREARRSYGQGASPRAMAAIPARVNPSRYVRM